MKKNWLICSVITILITAGYFTYQKVTADSYEGMSIVPEQHKDIPLFEGLELINQEYVMEGNHWNDILAFYKKELPKYDWEIVYHQSSPDEDSDITGFMLQGQKKELEWELSIRGSYFKMNNQTRVTYGKNPIYHSTTWIQDLPNSICIYENLNEEECMVIEDKTKLEEIKNLINNAIDWEKEKTADREKTSVIVFGNTEIKVHYENDKEIYLETEKGIKLLKPEPEFFELTNLSK